MDIDPLKVPAFQRKGKIQSIKKTKKRTTVKSVSVLKKENRLALLRRNRTMDVGTPAPLINEPISTASTLSSPSWRKMKCVGRVTQYFAKIDVIAIELNKSLKTGEHIIIQSPDGLFEQEVSSIQIDRKDVARAKKGDDIGIKVKFEPMLNGFVYKIVAEG